MRYFSTNRKSPEVGFKEAVINSLPQDNGLYFPAQIPQLGFSTADLKSMTLPEMGLSMMRPFIDEIPEAELKSILEDVLSFEILLRGDQPLVLVLPRGLKKRNDKTWIENVEKGRLLIISPFTKDITRVTRETAITKNETILDLSDQIVVGYKSPNGQLDQLLTNMVFNYI